MGKPRFSEFLSNRRRQLNLSIAQAARVLRLKDQVLIAFEEGDWDHIPRSGYAQGMLSSYARYLGLNPREVIDLFQADLADYMQGGYGRTSHASQRAYGQDPVYELPNTTTSAPRPHGAAVDKDLYGSAGPAGSILTGQSHLQAASSPLVQGRAAGYSPRYQGRSGADQTNSLGRDGEPSRRYTARPPRQAQDAGRRTSRQRERQRTGRTQADAERMHGGTIQTRRLESSDFTDDLRYGQAHRFETADSARGRANARQMERPTRPQVRRRTSSEVERQTRNRAMRRPQKQGIAGVIDAWFQSRTRTIATIFGAVALILTIIIAVSVSSCMAPHVEEGQPVSVTTGTANSNTQQESQETDDAATTDTSELTKPTEPLRDASTPVEAIVKLQDGAVTWIEVSNGGQSVVAGTMTGPWSQSFNVEGTLEVRANDPSVVEVTANGSPVQFDTMVSGIGTATVQGPTEPAPEGEAQADATSADEKPTGDEAQAASAEGQDGQDAAAAQ